MRCRFGAASYRKGLWEDYLKAPNARSGATGLVSWYIYATSETQMCHSLSPYIGQYMHRIVYLYEIFGFVNVVCLGTPHALCLGMKANTNKEESMDKEPEMTKEQWEQYCEQQMEISRKNVGSMLAKTNKATKEEI